LSNSGTISKGFAANENTKRATIVIYPTVSPETVIIPIVSCIIGFPILALLVICCLRRRAKLARERDRRRNIDLQDHAVSLVRINAIHRFSELTRRYKQNPCGLLYHQCISLV
uniref:Uncharacterized protein n=1 Tax=Anopheles atroparvus TaxID=41427 RepID=A0A182JB61_ANOAO